MREEKKKRGVVLKKRAVIKQRRVVIRQRLRSSSVLKNVRGVKAECYS